MTTGLKATPLNPLVNSTANPLAFFSAYIRRGWNDVTSTQSAFTVTEAMMRKGASPKVDFFRAEKKPPHFPASSVAPSLSPQASRLLKLLPPNPPSNEFKMGQYSSVNPHELNTGIIIEFFNTVWPKLDEDIKMLVLHQLRAKEPQNFEPNPPSSSSSSACRPLPEGFHSLRTRAPPPEPVPPHNPIAKSPTFTPLPEVVKLHFAKSCQDPAKFFDQSDNGETPTNPFQCGAYLALVQNKNIAWIGHIQLRFLTVGFHELELHLRETCQKLQPNRLFN
ncbi:hypothetical protein HRG_013723 [Hirsutella rhossiliensis]